MCTTFGLVLFHEWNSTREKRDKYNCLHVLTFVPPDLPYQRQFSLAVFIAYWSSIYIQQYAITPIFVMDVLGRVVRKSPTTCCSTCVQRSLGPVISIDFLMTWPSTPTQVKGHNQLRRSQITITAYPPFTKKNVINRCPLFFVLYSV